MGSVVGWFDVSATEVQGSVLMVMLVGFETALPGRAPFLVLEPSPPLPVAQGSRYLQQLVIPERGSQVVIPIDAVEWIEGDTYYARVHAVPRERLLRERLHVLESLLDPSVFMRIHRSAIVRVSAIREIRADSPYAFSVRLASGARAPLSRDKRRVLEETLDAGRR